MKEVVFIRIPLAPVYRILGDAVALGIAFGVGVALKHWWWSDLHLESWFTGELLCIWLRAQINGRS